MSIVWQRPSRETSLTGNPVFGKQRGAALILALTVLTIVAVIATAVSSDFLLVVRRVENQLHGKQAHAFMRGAEGIARQILQMDFDENTGKDHRSEGWLNQTVDFPLEQGAIAGTLCDLQGRFNLNNLPGGVQAGEQSADNRALLYTAHQALFIRLLQVLPLKETLDQSEAEAITEAVIDWIDSDSNRRPNGAEDGDYADLDVPMRTGNRALHRVSELRWVAGMTPELYRALAPHVTVLPVTTALNINTMGPMLMRAVNDKTLLQPLSEADAQSIIDERDGDIAGGLSQQHDGFEEVNDLVALHPTGQELDLSIYSVDSDYFLLQTETVFYDRHLKLYSLLHQDSSGAIRTLARGTQGLGRCIAEPRRE